MKKNLRNVLVLALGLVTTIASAQFGANSRTWIDNQDSDNRTATSRIALSADWGGIHASYDVDYNVSTGDYEHNVYEAYSSTDLMGWGTFTIGRSALNFGSGALIGDDAGWGNNRYTNDGMSLAMDLGGFAVTVGTMNGINNNDNYMNASGNFGGADVNILMMNNATDQKAHGYDVSYNMGDFTFTASMNSDFDGDEMTSYGFSYNVMDNLTASVSRTSYDADGVDGFSMAGTAMADGWANGSMGYISAGDENTSMSISYDLGDITLSYTTHSISNEAVDAAGNATPDREASSMSASYALNGNATIGLSRFSDDAGVWGDSDGDNEVTWLTLDIGF